MNLNNDYSILNSALKIFIQNLFQSCFADSVSTFSSKFCALKIYRHYEKLRF